MSQPFPRIPGRLRACSAVLAGALALAGCFYSFTGGGLPAHIRTVAIVPFENATSQPAIGTDVTQQLQRELPRKLGVRLADERAANAVVRGRITSYNEVATSFRPIEGGASRVEVPSMDVQVTFEAEIYDVKEDRVLWKQGGLSAVGRFQPSSEQASTGRLRAVEELVQKILEGAQSQW